MLSLRSLAFILCSAIRRARPLSCAALHCFPDSRHGIIEQKMATNMATNRAASMSVSYEQFTSGQGDHGSGRKGPLVKPADAPALKLRRASSRWTLKWANFGIVPVSRAIRKPFDGSV
jgi:hypothetical protein